jgi:cytidyltransferase-like protein
MIYTVVDSLGLSRKDMFSKYMVLCSGAFDPIHEGHIQYLAAAEDLGAEVVVIVNSDRYVQSKRGVVLLPWRTRAEIVHALKPVDHVLMWDEVNHDHIAGAIRLLRPAVFAKGGDHTVLTTLPTEEILACQETGTRIAVGVGGAKSRSSTDALVRFAQEWASKEKKT